MIALLAFHLLQVLWAGAYRRPREFTWWFGMVLLFLTLGFGQTGYQLPWDQKGYWATKVATNIVGGAPVIGPYVQKLLVGGPEYGNQTITRFFGLHVGLLPGFFVLCLVAHVALGRRQGSQSSRLARSVRRTVLAAPAFHGHGLQRRGPGRGGRAGAGRGRRQPGRPGRPLQLRLSGAAGVVFPLAVPDAQVISGTREVIGTFVIPTALLIVLFLLPLLDRLLPRRLAHFVACGFVFGVVGRPDISPPGPAG